MRVKKIVSAFLAAAMLTMSVPAAATANAVTRMENIHLQVMTENAENPDLYALASSLGADTDYFSFPNYRATEVSDELFAYVKKNGQVNAEGAFQQCQAGLCNGFSVLEILCHNGVISPSDLQEGAETLNDISLDNFVNDMLCYYSILQSYDLQELVYHEYFCSHDLTEQCQDLIKYGQKANETGKYFFIAFKGTDLAHAIVGIGMADGHWSFNGKDYDKCILTLDSNFIKKSDPDKSAGFDENGCIYINSEKNEFYFPAYESDSANEDTFITLVTDDTDMLNYLGYINPSESFDPEYGLIKNLEIHHGLCGPYELTIELDNKSETYRGYPETIIEGVTKNAWAPLSSIMGANYFRKADSITIEMNSRDDLYMTFLTKDVNSNMDYIWFKGKGKGTMSNNVLKYTNLSNDGSRYHLYATRNNNRIPWHGFEVSGGLSGTLSMEIRDDGIVLSTTEDQLESVASLHKFNYDENDEYIGDYCEFNVFSVSDIMIRCNENSDEFYFAIGENFETIVETGDVNCDGFIDAVDASLVLSDYANASIGERGILNHQLSDYNGDGMIDAVDASQILAEYASRSTV